MSNITLSDLKPAEGSTSKSKRVGRGRSSGHGKTSCRGPKIRQFKQKRF